MVILNLAYTAPINPSGASPALSPAQVWAGLQRKVRRAYEFVPVITSCDVVSEETIDIGLRVVRNVVFTPEASPKKDGSPVKEVCIHHAPTRIDFEQEDGSTISNIVSKGPDGELLMTYAFEWRHPSVAEGSEEANKLEEHHWKVSHFYRSLTGFGW